MSDSSAYQTPPASPSDPDSALLADCEQVESEVAALLTDCKQIESKIASLAIIDNTISFTPCFFSFSEKKIYSPFCHLTMTGDIEETCCDPTDPTSFENIWPKTLLHAPRLVITVYIHDTKPTSWRHPSDFFAVYHFFSSLAAFLSGSDLPKQDVQIKFLSTGNTIDKLLHPNVLASLDEFLVKPEVEPAGVWTSRHSTPESVQD